MSQTELDVIGIGNAIVDVLAQAEDGFLERHGMEKGSMTLIDESMADRLYESVSGAATHCSGGSAANTMVGIASLGRGAAYVGKLRDEGFPIAVAGIELLLKPDEHMHDEAFKRGALPTLGRVGEVIALFDNEPANCNLAKSLFPHCTVVQLETQKVPGAPALADDVEVIADFRTS